MRRLGRAELIKTGKIAVGCCLAYTAASLLGLRYATSAVTITLLSIQNTRRDTFRPGGKAQLRLPYRPGRILRSIFNSRLYRPLPGGVPAGVRAAVPPFRPDGRLVHEHRPGAAFLERRRHDPVRRP